MKSRWLVGLLVAVAALMLTAPGVAAAAEKDTRPPELHSLTIEPAKVDVSSSSQTVSFTARITDDLSGESFASVDLVAPSGEVHERANFERVEGGALDGLYRAKVTIPRAVQAGEWTVDEIFISDVADNNTDLRTAELKEAGLPYGVQVESAPDTQPPDLRSLSIEPTEADVTSVNAHIHFTARITDDLSGEYYASAELVSPSGKVHENGNLVLVEGDALDGVYFGKLNIPAFSEAGEWRVTEFFISDAAGNQTELRTAELQEAGFPTVVQVINHEQVEEPKDTEPPQLLELSFEPGEVDTSSSKVPVTIRAHIVDEGSGFGSGFGTFDAPSHETQVPSGEFIRVSGDQFDGTYEALATFEQGSEPGTWLVGSIFLADQAGNQVEIGPEQLVERGLPYAVTVVSTQAPAVTELFPASGPESGGDKVHIAGTGFSGASAVHFGAQLAEFVFESPGSITAFAPPGTGTVDVTVTTPNGTSEVTPADRYTYAPPVILTSSPNPSVHGQKVTFTAKVSPTAPGAPVPLGTVSFVEGTATLGVVNLNKGTATLNTTTLGAGEHPVVAEYSGDANYPAAASSSVTQSVAKAATQLTLTSALDPAPFGSSSAIKAAVKAVSPGAGTPAGTVTFSDGEAVIATIQLSGGNANLPLKSLPPGTHVIYAAYSGDANDLATEGGPLFQTITKAGTELTLTSTSNPAPFGSAGTLKAAVKAIAPGGGTPAGTVTFREGETVLAVVPLAGGSARYALKTTAPGAHPITATYGGEADYEGSSDSLEQVVVQAKTEATLTSSKNPAPHGSSGTLKATVKAVAPGGGTPASTVTFREGETVLAIVPLSSGVATYPLKALSVGTHEISAAYSGNSEYEPSEAAIGQVITP